MNNTSITTTTFCRKCFRLKSCLYTNAISNYKYLCKDCTKEEGLLVNCCVCGREGTIDMLNKGGYCHLCEDNHISECELCGAETYQSKLVDGICKKCHNGENKECMKCGDYFPRESLSSDNLCNKCSIKIHKHLRASQVNEVVECIECGREVLVNDTKNGLCIYCYSQELEVQIKKLKKRKKAYN